MNACPICKNGELEPGTVTVTLERDEAIVLLKKVPAKVCNNCASYFLDSITTRLVLQKAEVSFKNGAELEVLQLQAA
ncbi:MAG: type II toxin-antitoxin system MqsA family antitoxin [Lewinellaceae bacterium]|nr:type II toxin-antitoxin system MqsA family antitoxin [Lewinellaceae bacterium]